MWYTINNIKYKSGHSICDVWLDGGPLTVGGWVTGFYEAGTPHRGQKQRRAAQNTNDYKWYRKWGEGGGCQDAQLLHIEDHILVLILDPITTTCC